MARGYTAAELIKEIRDLSGINNTSADGATDADVLDHINAAIRELIMPIVHNTREDFNLVRERFAVPSTGILRIPVRAMWNKASAVWWVDGDIRVNMRPIPQDEVVDYDAGAVTTPDGYAIEGNTIRFYPPAAGTAEVCYFFRPGDLMQTTAARQVVSVDYTTGQIILSSTMPTAWEAKPAFDIHSKYSGAEIKTWNITPSVAAGLNMTFLADDIDGDTFGRLQVQTGDWVCLAEESALPAIPRELHPLIVRAVALRYAEAEGDAANARTHAGLLERMLTTAQACLEKRTEIRPIRVGPRKSPLYAARNNRFYW